MKKRIILAAIMPVVIAGIVFAQQTRQVRTRLPEGVVVHRDIAYVTGGHERQKLDLYLPKAEKRLPLIIWVHGGAWLEGSKENNVPTGYLADGFAVASVNYRLSQDALFPAQIEDCKAAVRWLRANAGKYNIDPNRFGAWGESAGGHLVALLGTMGQTDEFDKGEHTGVSSRVQAVVDYFGPTDFLQMDEHRLPDGLVHNAPDTPEAKLVGGPIQENKEKVAKANPITYMSKDDPPFLIVHGDADRLVPHHQSELLEAALKKVGVPVTFYIVKGEGHGRFKDLNVAKLTKEFFAKYLKGTQSEAEERKLVWADEFDYEGLPDPNKWDYEEGFVRNEEQQYYTRSRKENARVEEGVLIIEGRRERYKNPGFNSEQTRDWRRRREYADYTSASLITFNKASWKYGRVEVRAKLPKGKGVWPAIWMMGTNIPSVGWPACGEIDIMEFVGHTPDTVYANIHYRKDEQHKSSGGKIVVDKPFSTRGWLAPEDFHIYAMEWYPDRMDFYFDDNKYFTFEVKEADYKGDNPFRKPNYLLINLALGGSWGGEIDDSVLPQAYLIDYVRIYEMVSGGGKLVTAGR